MPFLTTVKASSAVKSVISFALPLSSLQKLISKEEPKNWLQTDMMAIIKGSRLTTNSQEKHI